jgi:hypothetical protein
VIVWPDRSDFEPALVIKFGQAPVQLALCRLLVGDSLLSDFTFCDIIQPLNPEYFQRTGMLKVAGSNGSRKDEAIFPMTDKPPHCTWGNIYPKEKIDI